MKKLLVLLTAIFIFGCDSKIQEKESDPLKPKLAKDALYYVDSPTDRWPAHYVCIEYKNPYGDSETFVTSTRSECELEANRRNKKISE